MAHTIRGTDGLIAVGLTVLKVTRRGKGIVIETGWVMLTVKRNTANLAGKKKSAETGIGMQTDMTEVIRRARGDTETGMTQKTE